eukprot:2403067-Rhodomonas_salina.1
MSGTDVAHHATRCSVQTCRTLLPACAMPGTDVAYYATRCPVLTSRMPLPCPPARRAVLAPPAPPQPLGDRVAERGGREAERDRDDRRRSPRRYQCRVPSERLLYGAMRCLVLTQDTRGVWYWCSTHMVRCDVGYGCSTCSCLPTRVLRAARSGTDLPHGTVYLRATPCPVLRLLLTRHTTLRRCYRQLPRSCTACSSTCGAPD